MKTDENSFDPLSAPERVPFPRIPQIDDFIDAPTSPVDRPGAGHALPVYLRSAGSDVTYPIVAGDELAALSAAPPRRRRHVRAVAVALAVLTVLGLQGWQLHRLGDRVEAADQRAAAALADQRSRDAATEARTKGLELQAQRAFNAETIAQAVLPSVFRVRAGRFTGTAFAVGDKAPKGAANLLTNYHVVASVWESGDREVTLERGGVDVPATVVEVDADEDLARLRMEVDVDGLAVASAVVKSGQQIVVVGAPLGLEDTVTTGVISAVRADSDGDGDGDGRRVQFDAPINPGNSGGPVINSAKQVVGLATAKARDAEGIGLAIPIATACRTFDVC